MPEEEETTGQEEPKAFKVSDRRFSVRGYEDEEGPSGEGEESAAPPREAPAESASEPPAAEEGEAPPSEEPAADEEADRRFEMLVAILQGNALAAMGLHPQTGERVGQADPRSSRMFVEMIGLVKEKMGGNLTPDEERLLDQVHSDLKMIFVQQVGIV